MNIGQVMVNLEDNGIGPEYIKEASSRYNNLIEEAGDNITDIVDDLFDNYVPMK